MAIVRSQSCMSLFVEMRCRGQIIASGTGIVGLSPSGRPALLTNWHNLAGRRPDNGALLDQPGGRVPDEVRILHLAEVGDLNDVSWVERFEELYDKDQKPKWLEHPLYGSRADVVALPLTQLTGVRLRPYVGPNVVPDFPIAYGPGDVVSVVGFPFGLSTVGAMAIWATGFVATEPQVDWGELPRFLIDCRGRPGQSGSAVIASRSGGAVTMEDGSSSLFNGPIARLLGLYSGRVNSESDLGIVWKTSVLTETLATVT